MSMKTLWLIDGLCIVLFIFIMVFIFALPSQQQSFLAPLFSIIYRIGAWIIGAGLLFNCLWGEGKSGLILGIKSGALTPLNLEKVLTSSVIGLLGSATGIEK